MKRCALLIAVAAAALCLETVRAQSLVYNYWTGSAGNTSFLDAGNWTPAVPLHSDYQSIVTLRPSSLGPSDFAQTNRVINLTAARNVACVRFMGMAGWTFTGSGLQIGMSNDGLNTAILADTPGTNAFACSLGLIKGTCKVDIGAGSTVIARNGLSWNSIMARVVGAGTLRVQGTHNAYSTSNPPTVTNGVVELAASSTIGNWQCLGVGVSRCYAASQAVNLMVSERGVFDCNGYAQSPTDVGIGAPLNLSAGNHGKNPGGTVIASNITFTAGRALRMGGGTILGRPQDLVSLSAPTFFVTGGASPSRVFTSVRASSTLTTACITNDVSRGTSAVDLDIYGNFVVANKNVKGPFLKRGAGITRIRGNLVLTNTVASGHSVDVQAGTLLCDGTGYLASPLRVAAGASFGGACTLPNAPTVIAGATLLPGNEAGQPLTCNGGLALDAGTVIAMAPAARQGGIVVRQSLAVTAPVSVAADLDGVVNGDYTVLDASAIPTTLDLSDFALTVTPASASASLQLLNGGTRMVLRKGVPATLVTIR